MSKKTFLEMYGGKDTDMGRRASLLRGFIIVVSVMTFAAMCIDLIDGDYANVRNAVIELLLFVPAFILLNRGNFRVASRLAIAAVVIFALSLAVTSQQVNVLNLYRNIGYYLIALTLATVCRAGRKTVGVAISACVITQIVYAYAILVPLGTEPQKTTIELVTSLMLFSVGVFLLFKEMNLSHTTERVLQDEQKSGKERIERMADAMKNAESTIQSFEMINKSIGDIRSLIADAGGVLKDITDKIGEIDKGADESVSATGIIGNRIDFLNLLIQGYVGSLQESSAAVNQMVASIQTVADSAEREREVMTALSQTSSAGEKQLESLLVSINQIEGSINAIQGMVGLINDIAEHTNLLSMNAAIEAAHAGASGKGFAVVAEEIRKLADNSAKQSTDISKQLQTVVTQINEAVSGSSVTKQSFKQIQEKIVLSNRSFDEIATATSELSTSGKDILRSMGELGEMSSKIKEGGKDITAAQRELKGTSDSLKLALEELNTKSADIIENNNRVLEAVEPIAKIGEDGVQYAARLRELKS